VSSSQGWFYGVWGATIAGWGIFLIFMACIPFKQREKWACNCLVVGLGVWNMSAPAGFGKTTLLSEWVAGCGRPVAWLSLDEGNNDLLLKTRRMQML
jgi:hypothetical protein